MPAVMVRVFAPTVQSLAAIADDLEFCIAFAHFRKSLGEHCVELVTAIPPELVGSCMDPLRWCRSRPDATVSGLGGLAVGNLLRAMELTLPGPFVATF
jgi:hypothetical protein